MKISNGVTGVVEVRKRLPSVIVGLVSLPIDLVKGVTLHCFKANDGFHIVFGNVVHNDR
jgi:hypothetical protein